MNKTLSTLAFVAGLIAVIWVGVGYIGASPLALAMTVLIGAVYLFGAAELLRFHRATDALEQALAAVPDKLPALGDWLQRLPPSLQNPVRLRIEGERVGLPGPALTPYLVGLLVLLGMLGTFLGMAVTLKGAVLALETSADLQAIRGALAAPVKGLGVAFGTSIAGVATSAMLGLISALCRRARHQTAQRLDTRIATTLRRFSLAHQRQEAYQALPAVVDQLQAVMARMEHQHRELGERLVGEQERFYRDAKGMYAGLAESVGHSLKESLTESARLAGETIQPLVAATMAGIAQETTALQERVADAVERQLEGISARFDASTATVADTWTAALARHEHTSEALAGKLHESQHAFSEAFAQRAEALLAAIRQQALAQHEQMSRTLAETAREIATASHAQASGTITEVARLMETAAEAPRAAAEVIVELRRELSASQARDNEVLAERSRILETLSTLLAAIDHASAAQREAIDTLVASAATLLERAGSRFEEGIATESARMAEITGEIRGGAIEVASLSEAFGHGVRLFADSNDKLMAALARIEGALEKSLTRSDEQLAYTVAQAREIIDLSIMSQRRIMEDLRQLAEKPALSGAV